MPKIPTFATPRLILRPASPGDLEDFIALGANAEVMQFIGHGNTQSPSQAAAWLEAILSDARHGIPLPHPPGIPGWLVVIERQSGAFAGLAVLSVLPPAHIAAIGPEFCPPAPVIEVGYRLAKPFWGKGYATEAAATLLRFGFETMHLPHIVAIADARNAASKRVIEKIGMRFRKSYQLSGISIDFYSLGTEKYGEISAEPISS